MATYKCSPYGDYEESSCKCCGSCSSEKPLPPPCPEKKCIPCFLCECPPCEGKPPHGDPEEYSGGPKPPCHEKDCVACCVMCKCPSGGHKPHFAGLYHNTQESVNVKSSAQVPLNSISAVNGLTVADNSVVVAESGVYEVSFDTKVVAKSECKVTAAVNVNGKALASATDVKNAEASELIDLSAKTFVPLSEGDRLEVVLSSKPNTALTFSSGTNAYLLVYKISD